MPSSRSRAFPDFFPTIFVVLARPRVNFLRSVSQLCGSMSLVGMQGGRRNAYKFSGDSNAHAALSDAHRREGSGPAMRLDRAELHAAHDPVVRSDVDGHAKYIRNHQQFRHDAFCSLATEVPLGTKKPQLKIFLPRVLIDSTFFWRY